MIKLRRIKISSAFKIGAVVAGLQYMIFGLFALLIQYAWLNAMMNLVLATSRNPQAASAFTGISFGTLLALYGCGIPVVGVFGGISAAIGAFFYNLSARFVGGVEIMIDYYDQTQQ